MIKTIRGKLILIFTTLILLLIVLGMLLNAFFLEDFYVYKNKGTFTEASDAIQKEMKRDLAGISEYISEIDRLDGISVMITGGREKILYVSYPLKKGKDENKIPKEIETLLGDSKECYTIIEKDKEEAPKLTYIRKLDVGYLVLTKPMKGVRESAAIANQFYVLAGVVLLVVGLLAAYVISRKVTKPITEMSRTAVKISNLDFGDRIAISSRDEIGELADSINSISEKLSFSLDHLLQDIERRKRMVRDMSHELKTPIGVIKGYSEGLKFGVAEDPAKMEQYCTVISEECDRMDQMVRQLLELAILEDPSNHLEPRRFAFSAIISFVKERFEPIMMQHGLRFDIEFKEDFELIADPVLLERAVSNLLTNAVKYNDQEKYIRLKVEKAGTDVLISVYNTGEGIPEELKDKVFEEFFKVDKARSRDTGGSGIGLTIVKSIMELHHGSIEIRNQSDGVEFILKLPAEFTSISH